MFGADYVHISRLWKSWFLHLVVVVLDVLDPVREYTFISVEIKSVWETVISWSFTSFVFDNTDTLYLPSPFVLTLCVLINTKGVDTLTFRHAGRSARQNLKTKLVSLVRFVWGSRGQGVIGGRRRFDFLRFSIWISKRDFLTFWLPDILSVWIYSSYFLNHLSVS